MASADFVKIATEVLTRCLSLPQVPEDIADQIRGTLELARSAQKRPTFTSAYDAPVYLEIELIAGYDATQGCRETFAHPGECAGVERVNEVIWSGPEGSGLPAIDVWPYLDAALRESVLEQCQEEFVKDQQRHFEAARGCW